MNLAAEPPIDDDARVTMRLFKDHGRWRFIAAFYVGKQQWGETYYFGRMIKLESEYE
jgi:hypothetical protein